MKKIEDMTYEEKLAYFQKLSKQRNTLGIIAIVLSFVSFALCVIAAIAKHVV